MRDATASKATLAGHDFLVGDRFTIADVSVVPRVAMYPLVQIPIAPERHAHVARWLERVENRPSFARSLEAPAPEA